MIQTEINYYYALLLTEPSINLSIAKFDINNYFNGVMLMVQLLKQSLYELLVQNECLA